jgi:hypothetical protein
MSSHRSPGIAPVSAADAPGRVRVSRMLLRLLDGERAELRVSCDPLPSDDEIDLDQVAAVAAQADPSAPEAQHQDALRRLACADIPATWTAIIGLDELPPDTRHVLRMATRLYEIDGLDVTRSDGLENLLRNLRDTTWTPEPTIASLH